MSRLHSALLIAGLLLLCGTAGLSQGQSKSDEELQDFRRKSYARGLMDEIEKKLLEPPDDGRFGVSRLTPMFVLHVHTVRGMEVYGYRLPGSPEGTLAEIHALGLFDSKGMPGRVTRGSEVASRLGGPTGRAQTTRIEGLEETLKKTASKLYLSGKKESWTSHMVQGRKVYVFARAILPKKDCLSCHKGAQMGRTMGIAAVTLVSQGSAKPSTRRP